MSLFEDHFFGNGCRTEAFELIIDPRKVGEQVAEVPVFALKRWARRLSGYYICFP